MKVKTIFLIIFVSSVLVLLQNSFLYVFFGGDLNPNLLWAFIFSLYLLDKESYAYLAALSGGLFMDMLNAGIIGYFSVLAVFFIIVTNYIKKYLFRGLITQVILLYLFAILFEFFYKTPVFVYKPSSIIQAFITASIALMFYSFERRFSSTAFKLNETTILRRNK